MFRTRNIWTSALVPQYNIRMTFARTLKAWRLESGVSQEQLAEWTKVSQQAVSLWERGSVPSAKAAFLLSMLMNIPIEDVLGVPRRKVA